ncbi:MAG: SsgA family sporulation/cell division regulator [Nocardioidaceae bacterium]
MDTTHTTAATFTRKLVAELCGPEGGTIPVPVGLSYDSSDPYAATLAFHVGERTVPWTFARDLLDQGMREPAGDGDVHVWPGLSDHGLAVVSIELCSPDGDALAELRSREVVAFIEHAHDLVGPGEESRHLDLDATIAAILADEVL